MIELQRLFGLRILGGVGFGRKYGVILFVPDQHAQPVERQGIAVHVLAHQRGLALLEIVEAQLGLLAIQRSVDEPQRLGQIENTIAAQIELGDVRRIDRQRHGARHQAVEVDPNGLDRARLDRPGGLGGRVVGLLFLIVLAGLLLLLVLGLVGRWRRAIVRGAAALVGLRRDRRGRVACQRDRVDSERLENGKIELDVRTHRDSRAGST